VLSEPLAKCDAARVVRVAGVVGNDDRHRCEKSAPLTVVVRYYIWRLRHHYLLTQRTRGIW
jgi:hypothetical protein